MSAAATAMAAGLSAGARRFVVQLELTNKTRASEQLASLGPASGKLFFKGRLALAAQAPASFLPFVWSASTFQLAKPFAAAGRSAFTPSLGRRQPAKDVAGQLRMA